MYLLLNKEGCVMYLKKVKNKKTGRIYLSIAQSYRDNSSKYPKATSILTSALSCFQEKNL